MPIEVRFWGLWEWEFPDGCCCILIWLPGSWALWPDILLPEANGPTPIIWDGFLRPWFDLVAGFPSLSLTGLFYPEAGQKRRILEQVELLTKRINCYVVEVWHWQLDGLNGFVGYDHILSVSWSWHWCVCYACLCQNLILPSWCCGLLRDHHFALR